MKKITVVLVLCMIFSFVVFEAQAKERIARRFVGGTILGAYVNDVLLNGVTSFGDALGRAFGGEGVGFIPMHAIGVGLQAQVSVPIGNRWAFRPCLGYQYIPWHSNDGGGDLSLTYYHSLSADLMFDVYFNPSYQFYPYFGFGPGVRHYLKPMVTLEGGTVYEINDNMILKFGVKASTLIAFTNVEPFFGLAYQF